MKQTNIIKLDGFDGEMTEDELERINEVVEKNNCTFEPGYFSFYIKGNIDDVEACTKKLWGMPRDEWEDNSLSIIE